MGSGKTTAGESGGVEIDVSGGVARLTLARPSKLNPLDWGAVKALKAAVLELEDRDDVRFVVVSGRGRAFSAGGDLEGYLSLYQRVDDFAYFLGDFHELLTRIESSRCIYVAAVNGVCVAGGLELLLACDLVVADAAAKIGDGHLNFGQLPGAGGSQRLPRAIGLLRAKHLMMTGAMIDAEEARRIGLVGEVAPAGALEEHVQRLVASLSRKSQAGLRGIKRLANRAGAGGALSEDLLYEAEYVRAYVASEPDAMEGLLAFKEKRDPRFAGGV